MIKIIPSLASANQLRLEEQIMELGGYPFLHIDMEDGNFVPNITFGMKTVRAAASMGDIELDAHLMVTRPEDYIDDLMDAGIMKIAIHIEATQYPAVYLNHIRDRGGTAGIAFNCMAQISRVLPYIDSMDYVLVMTSEPDGRGQLFNSRMLEKIREARKLLPDHISIMADGGVSEKNMNLVAESGADTLVMGRAVWNADNAGLQVNYLMKQLNKEKKDAGEVERKWVHA